MGTADRAPASVQEAISRCQRIVQLRRYALHPFVSELDRVRPGRAGLGRWAVQKYHQVFLQNVIFSLIHSNAQGDEEVRRYAMDQLVAEETGLVSGDAPHYVLMRRFAQACGAGPADFEAEACSAPVRDYVKRLVDLCRQPDVAIALLVIFAIEAQSAEAAASVGGWLASNTDFSARELAWFTVHAAEEDGHASEGLQLVLRLAPSTPAFARRSVDATDEITTAWLRLQDHYHRLLVAR